MRFRLRFLLLIVPCILIAAYFVIWHVQGYLDSKLENKSVPAWLNTYDNVTSLSQYILEQKITLGELDIATLNLWFNEELPASSSTSRLLGYLDHHSWKTDCWDRPFVAVGLDENHQPSADSAKAKSIGIYSVGKDGISSSQGCDPDDLASWRMDAGFSYYEQQQQNSYWHGRKIRALVILVVGSFSLLLVWLLVMVGYRMLFAKA
jgi:hypothetical protein